MQQSPAGTPPPARTPWTPIVARYRHPDVRRSVWQLLNTAIPLALLWVATYLSLGRSYWITLLLAVPTSFFLIRLFIIQHDCGHGSFFPAAWANDLLGSAIGVLTLTPYHYWRKTHAIHHATSGNLEHRGYGDISTLTVREYLALSRWARLRYRLYRHPAVLFGAGAAFHFLVKHRVPTIVPRKWKRERRSIMWTNAGLAVLVATMTATIGLKPFLMVQLPITLLSISLGVWLFYVQHQFEDTYWEHDPEWDYSMAGLQGSSYYRLPKVFQWLTGNIGLHHIHHLSSRIPNYRLQECYDENPVFQRVTEITFWQSLRCVTLTLWDEERRKLVGFWEARSLARAALGAFSA